MLVDAPFEDAPTVEYDPNEHSPPIGFQLATHPTETPAPHRAPRTRAEPPEGWTPPGARTRASVTPPPTLARLPPLLPPTPPPAARVDDSPLTGRSAPIDAGSPLGSPPRLPPRARATPGLAVHTARVAVPREDGRDAPSPDDYETAPTVPYPPLRELLTAIEAHTSWLKPVYQVLSDIKILGERHDSRDKRRTEESDNARSAEMAVLMSQPRWFQRVSMLLENKHVGRLGAVGTWMGGYVLGGVTLAIVDYMGLESEPFVRFVLHFLDLLRGVL